jgi:hypothetical protein
MSYYILPNLNNNIKIEFEISYEKNIPFISSSLSHYLKDIKKQINSFCHNKDKYQNIMVQDNNKSSRLNYNSKYPNQYEYIFTKVPNTHYEVCKQTDVFFCLLEIFHILQIIDPQKQLNSLHYGKHNISSYECINTIRKNDTDRHECKNMLDSIIKELQDNVDFLFYEYDNSEENINLIKILLNIFYYQKKNGSCIIKIENIFFKHMVDFIFILCNVYEKVYIMKPNASNITLCEIYIICKKLNVDKIKRNEYVQTFHKQLDLFIPLCLNKNNELPYFIKSFIKNDIMYYFNNKLEEFNVIIGNQQLNALDQLLSILKSKNRDEKIDSLRKLNTQKCIRWCEKFKIPLNTYNDKCNDEYSDECNRKQNYLSFSYEIQNHNEDDCIQEEYY